jgi:hypothetical protein
MVNWPARVLAVVVGFAEVVKAAGAKHSLVYTRRVLGFE